MIKHVIDDSAVKPFLPQNHSIGFADPPSAENREASNYSKIAMYVLRYNCYRATESSISRKQWPVIDSIDYHLLLVHPSDPLVGRQRCQREDASTLP